MITQGLMELLGRNKMITPGQYGNIREQAYSLSQPEIEKLYQQKLMGLMQGGAGGFMPVQPEIEALAQQRLKEQLAGNYTPAQQAWFQRAMQPQMAKLQQMGILRSGGAGMVMGRTAGGLAAQLQREALSEALGLGARQRGYGETAQQRYLQTLGMGGELGGRQRGYEQWGSEMGQRRYGMEGGWEQNRMQRELEQWMQKEREEEAKKERRSAFWRSAMGIGGSILGGLL